MPIKKTKKTVTAKKVKRTTGMHAPTMDTSHGNVLHITRSGNPSTAVVTLNGAKLGFVRAISVSRHDDLPNGLADVTISMYSLVKLED